jgi:hypothetical protein
MARQPVGRSFGRRFNRDSHDFALDKLIDRPKLIGIEDRVHWCTKEMKLFNPTGVGLLTEIDLVYQTDSGLYLAEYKCHDNQRPKAKRQLWTAQYFIEEEFGVRPTLLYVYGEKFKWERIPAQNVVPPPLGETSAGYVPPPYNDGRS